MLWKSKKIRKKKKQTEAIFDSSFESKKSLEDGDKEIEVKEKNTREALEDAQGLLKHGTESLVASKGDITALGIATVMIQSSQVKIC